MPSLLDLVRPKHCRRRVLAAVHEATRNGQHLPGYLLVRSADIVPAAGYVALASLQADGLIHAYWTTTHNVGRSYRVFSCTDCLITMRAPDLL